MAKRHPTLNYTRGVSDEVKAVFSKLTRDPDQPRQQRPSDKRDLPLSRDILEKQSKDIAQDSIDADSVFQLLPDVELAEQILVGSILSPKDMTNVELGFTVEEGRFDSEVTRPLLNVIETHFKEHYKINDRLDGMLEEILFTKGAHILTVLPENNLDQIINGASGLSMERYEQAMTRMQQTRPLGFLGHPREERVSMEQFHRFEDALKIKGVLKGKRSGPVELPHVEVTDKFDALKTPGLSKVGRHVKINNLLGRHNVSIESASKGMTAEQIDALYERPNQEGTTTQTVVPSLYMDKPSVGHPLVLKLPMESVIPVYVPGQPEEHIGYFVMIDHNGRPILRDKNRDYYTELRAGFKANTQDNTSELVRQTREAMGGVQPDNTENVDQIQKAYAEIIENDLVNRLRNGIYKEEFSLGSTEEIYTIMLHRSLKQQRTQLLYIPAELVTYMAFEYDDNGVGRSLLTKSKILSSMRSVLLFAETMSGVRNAVGRKKANINVDPDDPDPEKTISDIQSLILESSHRGFPLGSPDPGQTLDYLNRAGYDFSINVESDNYPTTKVDFDDYQSNVQAGNPELSDKLRRMHISGWGINPELVDPTQSPEFATSVVNNNLMMSRRVLRIQKRFTRYITHFVRNFTTHSATLRQELNEALKGCKQKLTPEHRKLDDETLLDTFIQAVSVSLPEPDTTRIDQQQQAFEQYSNLLDRALEAYITADLFPAEMLSREPDTVNHVISMIRAYYQRMWLERNNVLPELNQLTEMDGRKSKFSLLDVQKGQFKSLGEALQEYFEGINGIKEKWADKYQETVEETTDTSFGDDKSGDDDGLGGDDTFGEEDPLEGGEDDLGGEEDLDGDEDTTEDDSEEDDTGEDADTKT